MSRTFPHFGRLIFHNFREKNFSKKEEINLFIPLGNFLSIFGMT